MGGLRTKMPVTFWVYLIGALALAGIAPLAGFFSKDEILAAASQSNFLHFPGFAGSGFPDGFLHGPADSGWCSLASRAAKVRNMPARMYR